MSSNASRLVTHARRCLRRDKKNTHRLNVFECLSVWLTNCLSVCASLACLRVDCLLPCLVFPCERGAVGTGRRADVGGELQQRGGGAGEDAHVVAVCLLPTPRQGRAPPFPMHPLPSTSTSILNLHLYPGPPTLRSTSTSNLGPHLGSKLRRYPQTLARPSTSTSTLNLHLYPQPSPLPSTSTSTLKPHLYSQPPPLPSTPTSTLNPHLYPQPPPHFRLLRILTGCHAGQGSPERRLR